MKSVFLLVLFSLSTYAASQTNETVIGGPCITPGGEQGECVSIDDCPVLANLFANPMNGSEEFLYKFKCFGGVMSLYVCCISAWNSTNYLKELLYDSGWNSTNYGKGLSDRQYCGYQHTDDYFYTGDTTSIDEFPWLAALVSTDLSNGEDRIACHGSLINNRYILTTAYCASTLDGNRASKVVLGKYHRENTTSCVDLVGYGLECSEAQEFGIEEKIRHPFYNRRYYLCDIALIRLNKTASYTDYIRPICLPTQGTKFAEVGNILYTTGWGETIYNEYAPVKKKVKTVLIPSDRCQNTSIVPEVSSTYYICTYGLEKYREYLCHFDAGAPVMYSYRHQWQIEGIVRFRTFCDAHNPTLHTRVSPYIDWIKQNIRP